MLFLASFSTKLALNDSYVIYKSFWFILIHSLTLFAVLENIEMRFALYRVALQSSELSLILTFCIHFHLTIFARHFRDIFQDYVHTFVNGL